MFKYDTQYGETGIDATGKTITFDHTEIKKSLGQGSFIQFEIEAKTADMCLNFGATADTTLTAGKLVRGNYRVAAGSIKTIEVPLGAANVNIKAFASSGECWLASGYGERV